MKVILSNVLNDAYSNFIVVPDLVSLDKIPSMEVLIIHKYKHDNSFDVGVYLSRHSKDIDTILYISEDPETVTKMSVSGVGGYIFTDEFYLEDEDDLMVLLEDLGVATQTTTEVAETSSGIVRDFIEAYSRGDSRISAPLYLERVVNAVNEMSEIIHKEEMIKIEMGTAAMDIFKHASDIIAEISKQKKKFEEQLDELENIKNMKNAVSKKQTLSGIMFYSPYQYVGTEKVLFVREVSPCRYLTSFLLSYVHYLHYDRNKRVKFVIAHQKGKYVAEKYKDFTLISQDNMQNEDLYDKELISTNNPKKDVLDKIFSKNSEVVIVLDRLYSSDDIVTGRVTKVLAVSGNSDVEKFKLDTSKCIFTITEQPNELFHIPLIKNYPKEVDMQYVVYGQTCKDYFKKLNTMLGVL